MFLKLFHKSPNTERHWTIHSVLAEKILILARFTSFDHCQMGFDHCWVGFRRLRRPGLKSDKSKYIIYLKCSVLFENDYDSFKLTGLNDPQINFCLGLY